MKQRAGVFLSLAGRREGRRELGASMTRCGKRDGHGRRCPRPARPGGKSCGRCFATRKAWERSRVVRGLCRHCPARAEQPPLCERCRKKQRRRARTRYNPELRRAKYLETHPQAPRRPDVSGAREVIAAVARHGSYAAVARAWGITRQAVWSKAQWATALLASLPAQERE